MGRRVFLHPGGSALPAALFLTAMVALAGAALHLSVETELKLAVNVLECDRARFAAHSAVRQRSSELRDALARFRLPDGLHDLDVAVFQADPLRLLDAGVSGFSGQFGPWTLDLPLDGVPLAPLDPLAGSRSACHIEPAGVSGSPSAGLRFSYRCRISGEGRSLSPGRRGMAFLREEVSFSITLARFPLCHWQLCLPAGDTPFTEQRLFLSPGDWSGPLRVSGIPAFRGTGRPLSGQPGFAAAFLTTADDPAGWALADAADPQFALGRACRAGPLPALPPPGNLARAALGLPAGHNPRMEAAELLAALGLPAGSGRPPPGIYLFRGGNLTGGVYVEGDLRAVELRAEGGQQVILLDHAALSVPMVLRVDQVAGTTSVDGLSHPGLVTGPIYVEGGVGAISTGAGPPPPPALVSGAALTLAASGELRVCGDLTRSHPPGSGVLGLYSAGRQADGWPAAGRGLLLEGSHGRLFLDAAVAVGGAGHGLLVAEGTAVRIHGALAVEGLVQPELPARVAVTYDPRFGDPGFAPPDWPAAPSFEAYLSDWTLIRREAISRYQ